MGLGEAGGGGGSEAELVESAIYGVYVVVVGAWEG